MKKLAIYFSPPGILDYPLNKKEYHEGYIEIIETLKEKGVDTYIVRGDSYKGNGIFSKYSFWDGKKFIGKEKKIKADLIYNKDNLNTIPKITDCPIINHSEFDEICRDKLKTAEFFPKISSKTILVNSYTEALIAIKKIDGKKIVLKERFGDEGRGIFVIDKKNIKKNLYKDWKDILVQEFMDSKVGLKGMAKGMHDISAYIVNDKILNGMLREPKKGSYLANIALGGSSKFVSTKEMPKEMIGILKKINKKISKFYPLIARADFMNTDKGFKLVEINSRPGLEHKNWVGEKYWEFNSAIVDLIAKSLK